MKIILYISSILAFVSCVKENSISTNQNFSAAEDSTMMAVLTDSITREAVYIEDICYDSTGNIIKECLDSLLYASHTSVRHATVHYSPDYKLKIYVVTVESGVYSNANHYSFPCNSSNKKLIPDWNNDFTLIDSIYLLPDNKYLVLQHEYGRPISAMTVSCRSAYLVSILDDSLIFHKVWTNANVDDHNGYAFCQESSSPANFETSLTFDVKSMALFYRYAKDYNYCCHEDTDSVFYGEMKYQKGIFVPTKMHSEFLRQTEQE